MRVGWSWIFEETEGEGWAAGADGGGEEDLGGVGGWPIAVRMSGWWDDFDLGFEDVVGFGFLPVGLCAVLLSSLFRFSPFADFPRTARLCLSSSAKLTFPCAIASPSSIHSSIC